MQRTPPPRYRPPLKRTPIADSETGTFIGRCPHLGTMEDAGTALAFASDANQCYRTRLPVPVSTVHQQSYCLSGGYAECPVFQQNLRFAEAAPLVTAPPPSWGVPAEETVTNVVIAPARQAQGRRSAILPIVLLLALLLGGMWLWRGFLSQSETAQPPSQQDLAIGEATDLPSDLSPGTLPEEPGQAIVVTDPTTLPPTSSSTPEIVEEAAAASQGIALPVLPTTAAESASEDAAQAAECVSPEWWVPYLVQTDDTILGLAVIRGLAVDEIVQGNCLAEAELVVGQIVLLPPLATVIGITPTIRALVPTRGAEVIGSIVIVATQTPVVAPSATPVPTVVPGSTPIDDDEEPTRQPARPTATPVVTRILPTATLPGVEPSVTPVPPGPTATLPGVVPTATPPFEQPTQTPPGVGP